MLKWTNTISRTLWAFLCPSNGIPFSFPFFKSETNGIKRRHWYCYIMVEESGEWMNKIVLAIHFKIVSRWELTTVFRVFFASEFFNLDTTDILSQTILCCGDCPVGGGVFSSVSGLPPPGAGAAHPRKPKCLLLFLGVSTCPCPQSSWRTSAVCCCLTDSGSCESLLAIRANFDFNTPRLPKLNQEITQTGNDDPMDSIVLLWDSWVSLPKMGQSLPIL